MYYSKCENYEGNLTELSSGAAIITLETQDQVTGIFYVSFIRTIIMIINIIIFNI